MHPTDVGYTILFWAMHSRAVGQVCLLSPVGLVVGALQCWNAPGTAVRATEGGGGEEEDADEFFQEEPPSPKGVPSPLHPPRTKFLPAVHHQSILGSDQGLSEALLEFVSPAAHPRRCGLCGSTVQKVCARGPLPSPCSKKSRSVERLAFHCSEQQIQAGVRRKPPRPTIKAVAGGGGLRSGSVKSNCEKLPEIAVPHQTCRSLKEQHFCTGDTQGANKHAR